MCGGSQTRRWPRTNCNDELAKRTTHIRTHNRSHITRLGRSRDHRCRGDRGLRRWQLETSADEFTHGHDRRREHGPGRCADELAEPHPLTVQAEHWTKEHLFWLVPPQRAASPPEPRPPPAAG